MKKIISLLLLSGICSFSAFAQDTTYTRWGRGFIFKIVDKDGLGLTDKNKKIKCLIVIGFNLTQMGSNLNKIWQVKNLFFRSQPICLIFSRPYKLFRKSRIHRAHTNSKFRLPLLITKDIRFE